MQNKYRNTSIDFSLTLLIFFFMNLFLECSKDLYSKGSNFLAIILIIYIYIYKGTHFVSIMFKNSVNIIPAE